MYDGKSMKNYTFRYCTSNFLYKFVKSLIYHTMSLAKVIKQRRAILGITQLDLSEMAQIGISTIKDIERGKANPSLRSITKILDVLGLEMDFKIKTTF